MSLNTVRILHVVASALFLLALLASILLIFFQVQIKQLYTQDPEIITFRSAPIGSIVNALIHFLIAIVYMILLFALKPSKGGSIAVVIVLSVLLLFHGILISPAVNLLSQASANAYGLYSTASYSIVSEAASTLSAFFTGPAYILMAISMGGYWGQNIHKKAFPYFPAGPQNL